MRDRYNLNLLPGMSEDGLEYGEPWDRRGQAWWLLPALTAALRLFQMMWT